MNMDSLVPFLYGEKWGFSTRYPDARIVIDCIYDQVRPFQDSKAAVMFEGKWGLIDEDGVWSLDPLYEDLMPISDGRIPFKRNGEWGLMDEANRVIMEPVGFESMSHFSEGRSIVLKDGKYGYIDRDGRMVTELVFDDARDFQDGLATVKKEGKYACIDLSGNLCVGFISEIPIVFHEGKAAVAIPRTDRISGEETRTKSDTYVRKRYGYTCGSLFGYIDRHGVFLIEPTYQEAHDFEDGLALTCKNDRFGFINDRNEIVVPHIYLEANKFKEGLASVMSENHRMGFIDRSNNTVIPFEFIDAHDFSEGLARVYCKRETLRQFAVDLYAMVKILGEKKVKRGEDEFPILIKKDDLVDVFLTKEGKYIDFLSLIDIGGEYADDYYYYQTKFSEGKIAISLPWKGLFFIDRDCNIVSKKIFKDVAEFEHGLAPVLVGSPTPEDPQKTVQVYLDKFGFVYWHRKPDKKEGTVVVGRNEWSVKNLEVGSFSDGKPIPYISSIDDLMKQDSAENRSACCSCGFDPRNDSEYGRLYNWYAVNDASGLAPEGWRLPTDFDLAYLEDEYGCRNSSKLFFVKPPNAEGWSISGFDARFAGGVAEGNFTGLEEYTVFWSTQEINETHAWALLIENRMLIDGVWDWDYIQVLGAPKSAFYSVRLIRDLKPKIR